MVEISRRRLLGSALSGVGATAALSALPPNLRRVLTETSAPTNGSLDDIEHVVILMLENRSFDHYFGTLEGVRGYSDPTAATLSTGRSIYYQPDADNPDGYLLPWHLDTFSTSAQAIPSTSHAWAVQHSAWNNGKMDNWLPAHRAADGNAHGPYTMSYYERRDIPFHFALAEAFTVCDNYHCSVLGPTWPNRLYHWSGTIDPSGQYGGPIISNVVPQPYRWTSYPERLTKAGVSWHVYQEEDNYGCNPLEFFQAFQDAKPGEPLYDHGLTIAPAGQFAQDALHDRLPTVSWIIPTAVQSEHPSYIPAAGEDFLAQHLDAVAANPDVWRKTAFIVNYDENDGLFDHVIPPTAPAGTADEYVDGLPIGGGIRVPCLIVSPWTMGGFVASETFDHTSVLRFLETLTGVRETNITAWRRATFGDLTSAFGFSSPRPFPLLPPTKPRLWAAETEIATLPAPTLPGADQTPPQQNAGPPVHPLPGNEVGTVTLSGARPYSTSRIVENATTHAADFPTGTGGTNFPGLQEAVASTGPAAAASGSHAYATTITSYSIVVVDTATHTLVASIDAGTNPYGIAATPQGKLYITNSGASNVSILDTATGTISATTITVGLSPHGVTSAPDGNTVYVANTGPDTGPGGSQTVSVIDTASDQVTATWTVGLAPHSVVTSPDGKLLYVSCADALSVVDTGSGAVRHRLTDQAGAIGCAVSPDGSRLFVANTTRNTLSFVDTRTLRVVATAKVGTMPWQVAVSPDGSRVYVTGANNDTVTVLDARSARVLASVGVSHVPTGVTATADTVWVTTNAASTVDAIDVATGTLVGSVPLGLSSQPANIVVP